MKDYNTITADLLKNAPHGIDCYVSNVSYADALHDIHCIGDAVKRIIRAGRNNVQVFWGSDTKFDYTYVIPVHLVVKELFDGSVSIIEGTPDELTPRDKILCSFLCKIG